MALRGTLTHWKTRTLATALGISPCYALGILEALWHATAELAPAGNIGRLPNRAIAMEMFYDGDAEALMKALLESGHLDANEVHRFIVHDWHLHSDDATDNKLARHGQAYASGHTPRMRRLSKTEREKVLAQFPGSIPAVHTEGPGEKETESDFRTSLHVVRTENHEKPLPVPVPVPDPVPVPEPVKEQKQKLSAPAVPVSAESEPEAFLEAWNANCGKLPKVLKLSSERRRKVLARIRQGMHLQQFTEAVGIAARTPFLLGEAGGERSGWKCDFDFLIANDTNLLKVLEGKYGEAAKGKAKYIDVTGLPGGPEAWWSGKPVANA